MLTLTLTPGERASAGRSEFLFCSGSRAAGVPATAGERASRVRPAGERLHGRQQETVARPRRRRAAAPAASGCKRVRGAA